jgi:hypothetical protein
MRQILCLPGVPGAAIQLQEKFCVVADEEVHEAPGRWNDLFWATPRLGRRSLAEWLSPCGMEIAWLKVE